MIRKALIPLTLLLLGGCAAAPNWSTIDQQAFAIRAACERQYLDGLISSALGTERCANGSIRQLYASAGYPRLDVLDLYLARREAIAAAIDRRTIPPADAHVKLAEAQTEQNVALQQHGVDPIVFDVAPLQVQETCPRPSLVARLCN